MTDIVFNRAKGAFAHLATLPAANDALVAVVLTSAGLAADSVNRDLDDLAAVLTNNTEHSAMGRKTITAPTVTVDDTVDKVFVDFPDLTWTSATGAATGKVFVGYDGDTTGGGDANITPCLLLDFAATPNGGDLTYAVNASGAYEAA